MENLLTYKCPCCGGAIEFDSKLQKMKCPYCDTEFESDTLKAFDEALKQGSEESFDKAKTTDKTWTDEESEGLSVFVCKSCGGEVVAKSTTSATFCPFCDNPVVISGRLSGELYPDKVIPFAVDKNTAKKTLSSFFLKKRLLPKAFKNEDHLDEMKGVYLPYWFYNGDASAYIRYDATKVTSWSDKDYIYTRTAHYMLIRDGDLSFLNIPSDGSSEFDDAVSESIEPFDFSGAADFSAQYLSGFYAERYDLSSDKCIDRVKVRMKNTTETAIASTALGYTTVTPVQTSIKVSNSEAKYVLCPVWILNTSWNGKKYPFYVNGQTGKIIGDLPLDKGAYWRWLCGLTASISAGLALVMTLLHFLFM